jgi:two-component system phosphate regulon sensor histidine kinase PhoR
VRRHPVGDQVVVLDDQNFRHAILRVMARSEYEELRAAFTASVSHELRTPLARLVTLLESAELPGADLPALLAQAREEVDEMTELVDDILFLSELEQGREVVALGETEAVPVLRDVLAERADRAERAGVRLELRLDDETIRVPLRRRMLRTVVENLVENAIRYAGEGATCVVSLSRDANSVLLEVSDDGTGVPEEDAPRLFERFFRSDRARTTRGSGLGLAIVKHVAEAAGGHVEARGAKGRGLDVRVHLPLP